MTSQSTTKEIFDSLKATVNGYIEALESYSEVQFTHKEIGRAHV